MTWQAPGALARQRILNRTRAVTIIGASANPARPSHFVASYLLASSDYEVSFVNPTLTELLGKPVYPSLAEVPGNPDLVSVFRKHEDLPAVAEEVIAAGARTLWLQLGLWHEEVAERASAAGLDVVMDRCVKIEHARFHGGLHLAGFDTGVIDSRRPS
ncbi:CoA-binding protein [Sciscionella sediminilitoris]|uniref:CoA-binding protein n=1 Tax=Sciscionella sediminilitoris TaxID=1445613 RepID=UPI0004DEF323|nr:CoA-binding protein [Sciscionella sp. SE31]